MNTDEIVKGLRCEAAIYSDECNRTDCTKCKYSFYPEKPYSYRDLYHAAADLIERQQDTLIKVKVALQEKRERDNPQPLTIGQLQQMDSQPVWCPTYGWGIVDTRFRRKARISIVFSRGWKVAQLILPNGIYLHELKECIHDP